MKRVLAYSQEEICRLIAEDAARETEYVENGASALIVRLQWEPESGFYAIALRKDGEDLVKR